MYVYDMPHESAANRQNRLLKISRYLGLSYAEGGRPLPGASLRSRYTRDGPYPCRRASTRTLTSCAPKSKHWSGDSTALRSRAGSPLTAGIRPVRSA